MIENDKIYNISDVAKLLQASEETIRKILKLKQLAFFRVGRVIKIQGKEIKQYIKRMTINA